MAKSHLKLVSPAIKKRTVTPRRRRNGDLRTREYLTEAEVERLMKAAASNRHGHRDATMTSGLPARPAGFCTSAGPSRALPAPIRSWATNCAPSGGSSASRNRSRPSCSPPSGARRSRRPATPAWSSAPASPPSLASRRTHTCSGTPAAMPWRTRDTTPGHCRPTLGTKISSIRCAIPSYRRCGSRISGGPKPLIHRV